MQVAHHRAGRAQAGFEAGELIFNGASVGVHVDEDKAGCFLDPDGDQAGPVAVEVGHVVAVAGMGQLAIQLEGPGVIRTGDDVLGAAAALHQLVAPVRADVVERPQDAVAVAQHDDALADDLARDVVVGRGQFAAVGHADPGVGEDLFLFVVEDGVLRVVRGGQGPGVFFVSAEVGG
ncbi:hypothetical protein D3C86_755290 [compost metagenome]